MWAQLAFSEYRKLFAQLMWILGVLPSLVLIGGFNHGQNHLWVKLPINISTDAFSSFTVLLGHLKALWTFGL